MSFLIYYVTKLTSSHCHLWLNNRENLFYTPNLLKLSPFTKSPFGKLHLTTVDQISLIVLSTIYLSNFLYQVIITCSYRKSEAPFLYLGHFSLTGFCPVLYRPLVSDAKHEKLHFLPAVTDADNTKTFLL